MDTPKTREEIDRMLDNRRRVVWEMINASCELAERLGPHPLEPGCPCIACAKKRKEILYPRPTECKYFL